MTEATQLLQQAEAGSDDAIDRLLPSVCEELRRLAAAKMSTERSDDSLQTTSPVHEACLRLVGSSGAVEWPSRDADGNADVQTGTGRFDAMEGDDRHRSAPINTDQQTAHTVVRRALTLQRILAPRNPSKLKSRHV